MNSYPRTPRWSAAEYFMISISEAIDIIRRETPKLAAVSVDLPDAARRVLAEDVVADSDLPPFDRSQMDGYAVKASDAAKTPARLKIVGESAAGAGWHEKLKKGQAVRIMTGAPVPAGADAVQKIEVTKEAGEFVEILEPTERGKFIIRRGAEIKKGAVVIPSGDIVTGNMVAVLAAFGYSSVRVGEKPMAAILATGREIVDVDLTPERDQIRNSNSPMLRGFIEACGAGVVTLPAAGDDVQSLKKQISKGVEQADLLVITGGVSVGKYDFTKTALAESGPKFFLRGSGSSPANRRSLPGSRIGWFSGFPVTRFRWRLPFFSLSARRCFKCRERE